MLQEDAGVGTCEQQQAAPYLGYAVANLLQHVLHEVMRQRPHLQTHITGRNQTQSNTIVLSPARAAP
jgi:hypothetical protein